jgi:diguanylate cyclase (GGDEF)-like protein
MSHDQPEAPRPKPFARVKLPLLTMLLAGITAAALLPIRHAQPVSHAVSLPLWFAVALFAISVLVLVDIPTRRDMHTVTLADLPIVLALFFLTPVAAVLSGVAGLCFALVLVLRQRGVKLLFNVAQFGLQVLVAVAVFRLVLMHASPDGIRAWLAAGLAALVADGLSGLLVTLAVWLHSGTFNRDLTVWVSVTGGAAVIAKTALALLAVVVLQHNAPSSLALLAIVTALMYAAYRMYSHLYLRHQRVEKLYRFTNAVAGSVELSDVAELAVREARELLDAHAAELVLLGNTNLVVAYDEDGPLAHTAVERVDASVLEHFNEQVRIVEIERGTELDGWLDARGWEYALAASLSGDNGDGWIAVAREADDEPFGAADLQLFEAIATQTSVALENGRLLDALSHAARLREHRALHDPLTELPNRVQLTDTLTSAVDVAGDDMRFALLVVGLDDFRDINETLGHDHGDAVLREVAHRLVELSDGGWTTARLGGDEFALLVPDSRGIGAAVRSAEGIARAFEEQPFHVAGLVIEVGVSVGVAMHPDHGTSAQQLLRRAEIAMRAAKGRHARVNAFIPSDDPHSPRQLGLAHELRQAL